MLNKHVKSPCCGARVIRFGGKRRQCVQCRKTWRIKQSRRGRKPQRVKVGYIKNVFIDGLSVRQIPTTRKLTNSAIDKRFAIALNKIVSQPRRYYLRGEELILLVDAQWHRFKGKFWTLYFVALRSVNKEKAIIFDPVLGEGKESLSNWVKVIDNIPNSIKKRLVAVVSDGFPGLNNIFKTNGWIVQRCHFHLIAELQRRRARKRNFSGRPIREMAYQTIKELLVTTSTDRTSLLFKRLNRISNNHICPTKIKMIVREFVRCNSEFRSYLQYPELNLPNTNNIMESVSSFVRSRSAKLKTPNAWHKWAIATIRFHPKFVCKIAKLPTKLFP